MELQLRPLSRENSFPTIAFAALTTIAAALAMFEDYSGRNLPSVRQASTVEGTVTRSLTPWAPKKIVIRGARQHNLKNISLEIPRQLADRLSPASSGSGKSSLAFDTLYAEGQRRYVWNRSPPTPASFLDQMERPDVDSVEGLSPSIAIEQKTTTRSPRSTVGTITEIYDYLAGQFTARSALRIARSAASPSPGNPPKKSCSRYSGAQARRPHHGPRARSFADAKANTRKNLEKYAKEGYVRARVDGDLVNLDEADSARSPQESHHRNRRGPAASQERASRAAPRSNPSRRLYASPAALSPSRLWAARSTSTPKSSPAPTA